MVIEVYFSFPPSTHLCYSRDPRHSEYNTLIVSIQMCASSESVPQNYEVISTTADTKKPALKNNLRIIYRRLPLVQTSAVISDIAIYDQKSNLPSRWSCIAVINNMQLVIKQTSKREMESQNSGDNPQISMQSNVENSSKPQRSNILNPMSNLDSNSLQKSQFRSAKSRNENTNFSGYSTNATGTSLPHSSFSGTGARMVNSQTSVCKVGPVDGLEFTVSKKVQTNQNAPQSFGSEEFIAHNSKELADIDFGEEEREIERLNSM